MIPPGDITEAMYLSLKSYPCRCVYMRKENGQPVVGKDGNRILEKQCSMHASTIAYERLLLE